MKTVKAELFIQVNLECPHCESYLDLLDNNDFPHLNDEGEVLNYACPSDGAWIDSQRLYKETVQCPECKKEFIVKGIAW